jgi:hypothetical protein
MACLARDEHLVTMAVKVILQNASEVGFRAAWNRTVVVGKVEMADSCVERFHYHVCRHTEVIDRTEVVP